MAQTPSRAVRPALVALLLAQMAFGLLAMTLCIPSMQDWPQQFAASQAQVQLTFSLYVAAYGLVQLVYGPLSDRLGRKRVLMGGLFLAVLGSAAAWLADSLEAPRLARRRQCCGHGGGQGAGARLVRGP